MTTLYSGKVGLSRLFSATTVILLLLFTLSFGSWWAVGRSAGAEGVATSLLSNAEVRTGVAEKLIDQVTSDADPEIKDVVKQKKELLIQAVSEALTDPTLQAETTKIVDEVYAFYTGETKSASIDVKVLIDPIIQSMAKVDPSFKSDGVDTSAVKPIELDNSAGTPNLAPVKSGLAISVFVLFALLVLSIFGVARFARAKNSFVGVIGWEFTSIGVLLLAIFFGANAVVKAAANSSNDPLVNSAAPVVAQTFLEMFRLEGILLLIVGIIGIATWARARKAPQGQ